MEERSTEKNSEGKSNNCRVLNVYINRCNECPHFYTYANLDFPRLYTGICKYNNYIVVSGGLAEVIREAHIPDWCHLKKAGNNVELSELKIGDICRVGACSQLYMYLGTRNDSHCFICIEGKSNLVSWSEDVCRKHKVPVGTIPVCSTKNFTKIDNPY